MSVTVDANVLVYASNEADPGTRPHARWSSGSPRV
jgi:hypothetical protein